MFLTVLHSINVSSCQGSGVSTTTLAWRVPFSYLRTFDYCIVMSSLAGYLRWYAHLYIHATINAYHHVMQLDKTLQLQEPLPNFSSLPLPTIPVALTVSLSKMKLSCFEPLTWTCLSPTKVVGFRVATHAAYGIVKHKTSECSILARE